MRWTAIFLSAVALTANAVELPVRSGAAVVVDADTGDVMYDKNGDIIAPIASITKLMTAVVTLDAGLDPDERIEITAEDAVATNIRGRATSTSLKVGTSVSREELIRLTLMNSQNRAAAALARTYPGGRNVFIAAMNTKAMLIGMTHTMYTDPTGLLNTNTSTAKDLALLVQYAQEYYPQIAEYSTMPSYAISAYTSKPRSFGTTNRLVVSKGWDILLQKTGYIQDAGRCVAMMANVAYKRVIIVLLNAKSASQRANDAVIIKYWIEHDSIPSISTTRALNPYAKKVAKRRRR